MLSKIISYLFNNEVVTAWDFPDERAIGNLLHNDRSQN